MKKINERIIGLLVICCTFAATAANGATQYVITDILPTNARAGIAFGISDTGYVVGGFASTFADSGQAFIWDNSRGFRPLSTQGTAFNVAFAVNDQGIVVGQYHDSFGNPHACMWDIDGNKHDLPGQCGAAIAINNNGLAVGSGYIWDVNSNNPSMVATISGDSCGINDLGQVVGGRNSKAFVRDTDGTIHNLGGDSTDESRANSINNFGQAVGFYDPIYGSDDTPCLWDSNGNRQDIGVLNGDYRGSARGINDAGTVVGSSSNYSYSNHAFVWTKTDGIQMLSGLGGAGTNAIDINSSGIIVGDATSRSQRAVIWTPVPEPSSVFILIVGLGGTLGTVRRRWLLSKTTPK